MFLYLATYSDLALLALRIATGTIIFVHGWAKITNLRGTISSFNQMGFRPGIIFGTLTAFLEFLGSIAILVGLFIQPISILFFIQFLVIIIWKLFKRNKFFGDLELDILILGTFIAMIALGAGNYSIDSFLSLY